MYEQRYSVPCDQLLKYLQKIAGSLGRGHTGEEVQRYYKHIMHHETGGEKPSPEGERHGISKHGRRVNSRKGIPMHIMATYALFRLPNFEGNLSEMAAKIEECEFFRRQLDHTARPGTKTYPRCDPLFPQCIGTCVAPVRVDVETPRMIKVLRFRRARSELLSV
jgi:hypothetical protein